MGGSRRRARPGSRVWLFSFLLFLGLTDAAFGQVPPVPGDTVPADTVEIPIPPEEVGGDTIPLAIREAAEAPLPADLTPEFPAGPPPGWDIARWEWTAEDLALLPGMTLLEFIERLPGITKIRAGGFGRPAGLTAFGFGGGRLRVFLDGYELDPLGTGSFELETLAILDLHRIRVDRTLSGIRVDAQSYRLESPEPHSEVALGTGVYQTRLLRALFSRGFGQRVVGTGSFDLASTGGLGIREPYSHSSAVMRWSYARSESSGIQLDWRRTGIDRSGTAFPQHTTRTDLVLTGRSAINPRLIVEALVGRATLVDDVEDAPDPLRPIQAAARAAYATETLFAEAGLRLRARGQPAAPVPSAEATARGGFLLGRFLRVDGEASTATGDGLAAGMGRLSGTVTPWPGLSLFASGEAGSRLVPVVARDPTDAQSPETGAPHHQIRGEATGWRAGGEIARAFGSVGAAVFTSPAITAAPLGLPFDYGSPVVATDPLTGLETSLFIPFPRTGGRLWLDGWYSLFSGSEARPYAPRDQGRAAIAFRDLFFEDELEPSLRIEAVRRGFVTVPAAPGESFARQMPPIQTLHLALQIRVIDVQLFLLWDNLLGDRTAVDFPGDPEALPRIVYGATWRFRN